MARVWGALAQSGGSYLDQLGHAPRFDLHRERATGGGSRNSAARKMQRGQQARERTQSRGSLETAVWRRRRRQTGALSLFPRLGVCPLSVRVDRHEDRGSVRAVLAAGQLFQKVT